MLRIENTEILDWGYAIHGMRDPMSSWKKSNSEWVLYDVNPHSLDIPTLMSKCQVGPDDLDLIIRLHSAGTDHQELMRMITVYVDLIGPLYWQKELDIYKVGMVANSCSTVHKIAAKESIPEDLSYEYLFGSASDGDTDCWTYPTEGICEIEPADILNLTIAMLNKAGELYLDYQQRASTNDQFTKDHVKEHWW